MVRGIGVAAFSFGCVLAGAASAAASSGEDLLFDPTQLSFDELINTTITSVSKKAERLQDAAAAIFVLTNDDIRRAHVKSIPDALRLVPGVQVQQTDSSGYNVNVRGTSGAFSNKLLVLVDGRIIYNPLFAGVIWETQDVVLEDVDRIEVIRGPGGTLWGANAVNGVINIITKSAADTQGNLLVAATGSDVRSHAVFRHGGELGDAGHFRVYGKRRDGGETERRNDTAVAASGNFPANDSWRSDQGGFRMDLSGGAGRSHTLQGDTYHIAVNENPQGTGTSHYYGHNLLYRMENKLSDHSDYSVKAYWDYTQLDTAGFEDQRDTLDFEFQYHYDPAGMHELIWGLGYRFVADDIQPGSFFLGTGIPHEPEEREDSTVSFFVQDEITVSDQLKLTFGTKVEDNDYSGVEFQPTARFSYAIDDTTTTWGAVSRAVRVPSRLESDILIPGLFAGNKNLDAEVLLAYELGYRARLANTLSIDVATFLHDYDELIFFLPLGAPAPNARNIAEGKTWGLEVSSRWKPTDPWTLDFAYTWLQARIDDEPGANTFGATRIAGHSDAANRFSVFSRYELQQNLEFDAILRYVDNVHGAGFVANAAGAGEASVPSYLELDLGLTFKPRKDLHFEIAARNLLDDEHPESLMGTTGATAFTRNEIQRSIHGTVTWNF